MDIKELQKRILEEKKRSGTVILAHTYQSPDIIEIADEAGDSYALAQAAKKYENKRVVVCGVRFMAETVKILSPEKDVVLPVSGATCPMAEQISPERVAEFKKENPETAVVAYVNTTAALKAECDVCVTSSSAVKIVSAMPEKDILFIPDKNLGSFVAEKVPEKNIILWDGFCPVHNQVTAEEVKEIREEHPEALLAVHPECPAEVVKGADFIGATSGIIKFALSADKPVIIGTEGGVYDYLAPRNPEKTFYQLAPKKLICEDMKKTSLEDVYKALTGEGGEEIVLPEELRVRAKKCLENMLKYGG